MDNEQKEPHRIRYAVVLAKVQLACGDKHNPVACRDILDLKQTMEGYIKAKGDWTLNNTDETMIYMIGKWARMSRLLREAEEKYA